VTRDDPAALDLAQLRARRLELQQLDDVVSYVRRVAQARADLARAELARRTGGDASELTDELRGVLADRLLAGSDRPPRPAEDFSEHPRAIELDRLCADHGFGRLSELDPDELAGLVTALDDFERRVSAERHDVFARLDELTDELVRRYREDGVAGTVPEDAGE
jgi:predicted component of type VI protein secretion system